MSNSGVPTHIYHHQKQPPDPESSVTARSTIQLLHPTNGLCPPSNLTRSAAGLHTCKFIRSRVGAPATKIHLFQYTKLMLHRRHPHCSTLKQNILTQVHRTNGFVIAPHAPSTTLSSSNWSCHSLHRSGEPEHFDLRENTLIIENFVGPFSGCVSNPSWTSFRSIHR